jgi:UDP-N-acetyl-D-glucosamine dehydrogenase
MKETGAAGAEEFLRKIEAGTAVIAIIGLGYVGLPLAVAFARGGFGVIGLDIDPGKVRRINAGESYIASVPAGLVAPLVREGRLRATDCFDQLRAADAVVICVPTPITPNRDPDLRFVISTAEKVAEALRPGQLVILESTTYPGTTSEVVGPILERSGLRSGTDFFLAYSPEREDPGNAQFTTSRIPKVVGADHPDALRLADALYARVVAGTVPVSSAATAEAVKLTENIFRAVNIALVNELKVVYSRMGIDIWEVIEAAKTKPFGFMPFYPGPGLGGHCIPIDPFYLTWKAREYGVTTRFIELAGEINTSMPRYVLDRLGREMDARFGRGFRDARILVLGAAYKKNVDDTRESPALRIMEMLQELGAEVDYYDPHVPEIPPMREHAGLAGTRSIAWDREKLKSYSAVLIVTDHDAVDYQELVSNSRLVVDTRNATRSVQDYRERIAPA